MDVIPKVLMWTWWSLIAAATASVTFSPLREIATRHPFESPSAFITLQLALFPPVVSFVLRCLLAFVRRPWSALLPYLFGVALAFSTAVRGLTEFTQHFLAYQVMSWALLIAYLPPLLRWRKPVATNLSPPPLNALE